jgi:hypothetical protein
MELPDIMAAASKYTHEVKESHAGQDGIPNDPNKDDPDNNSYVEQGEAILVESFLMGGLVISITIVAVVAYGTGQYGGHGTGISSMLERPNRGDASTQDGGPNYDWVDTGFDRSEML